MFFNSEKCIGDIGINTKKGDSKVGIEALKKVNKLSDEELENIAGGDGVIKIATSECYLELLLSSVANGEIKAQGNPDELIVSCKDYKAFYQEKTNELHIFNKSNTRQYN